VHLVAVLPAWLLARLSLEQYLAWTRASPVLTFATGLVRSGLVLRRCGGARSMRAGGSLASRRLGSRDRAPGTGHRRRLCRAAARDSAGRARQPVIGFDVFDTLVHARIEPEAVRIASPSAPAG
jgi:hypothetical protein